MGTDLFKGHCPCGDTKMGTQTLATALQRALSGVLWPLDQQGAPGMGDVVLQALLSFTPGMPNATGVLLPWGSTGGLGIQNPESEAQNAMKEELERAIVASLDGAPHSLKGSGEELLLCHGRVSKGIQECLRVRIHP